MVDFTLGNTDRVVLIGPSDSGKSTLIRALTRGYRSQVVIDAKHEESIAAGAIVYTPADFARTFPQRSRRVVFRPDPELAGSDDVDQVLRRTLRYGQTAIVVHDGALYATSGWIVPSYRRAQLIGRTIGCPVWTGLQRPIGIHNVLLSELTHVFLFDLVLESDRMKVAGIVGPGALESPGRRFSFGYYGPSSGGLVRCDPLEVPNAPSDDRQPGPGHDHGHGRDLRRQGADQDRERARPERPGQRHLSRPSSIPDGPERRPRIPAR